MMLSSKSVILNWKLNLRDNLRKCRLQFTALTHTIEVTHVLTPATHSLGSRLDPFLWIWQDWNLMTYNLCCVYVLYVYFNSRSSCNKLELLLVKTVLNFKAVCNVSFILKSVICWSSKRDNVTFQAVCTLRRRIAYEERVVKAVEYVLSIYQPWFHPELFPGNLMSLLLLHMFVMMNICESLHGQISDVLLNFPPCRPSQT